MLGWIICAFIMALCIILAIILIKDSYVKIVVSGISAIFCCVSIIAGIVTVDTAKDRFNKCLELKSVIEENYKAENILSQHEAHEAYFQYKFLYEYIKNSKEEDGIFSSYYWMDIEKLELELSE